MPRKQTQHAVSPAVDLVDLVEPAATDEREHTMPRAATPEQLAHALPLMDLISMLDEHAGRLDKTPTLDSAFPVPDGLPFHFSAPIDLLQRGRYQPRTEFDESELAELVESIKLHGILTPLKVFANEHGRLEIVAGERRMRAARNAGIGLVPVELARYTLRQVDEIATVDNIQRANLSALDEGRAFDRMIREHAISEAELSRRIGKSRAYIQHRRALAGADPKLQEAVADGTLSFTQARTVLLAASDAPAAQREALAAIKKEQNAGWKVSEEQARELAERAVRLTTDEQIKALGWLLHSSHHGSFVYAPGERPAEWSAAERLQVIKEQRRPEGSPLVERPVPDSHKSTLSAEGKYVTTFPGSAWLLVYWYVNNDGHAAVYSPDEFDELVRTTRMRFDALEERANAIGWKIDTDATSIREINGTSYKYCRNLDGAEKELQTLEATGGTLPPEPAAKPAEQAVCEVCGNLTPKVAWERRQACPVCKQAEAERQKVLRQQIGRRIAATIDGASGSVFELLAVLAHYYTSAANDVDAIVNWSLHCLERFSMDEKKRFLAALVDVDENAPPVLRPVENAPAYLVDGLAAIGLTLRSDAGTFVLVDRAGAVVRDAERFDSLDNVDEWLELDAADTVARDTLPHITFSNEATPADVAHVARQCIVLAKCLAADSDYAAYLEVDDLRLDLEGCAEAVDDPSYDELMARFAEVEKLYHAEGA